MKRHVLIVPDGAADRYRTASGLSPLGAAYTPYMDAVAASGSTGLMNCLHPDLPRESLVAHLGMLGWDPHRYYPGGRASSELLALKDVQLEAHDVAFRANLVRFKDGVLASYSANGIVDAEAAPLVAQVAEQLRGDFPECEIYHIADFRTVLVVRDARIRPAQLHCREPHDCEGLPFDLAGLVEGRDRNGMLLARRLNGYLLRAAELLDGKQANALLPWSPSSAFALPAFRLHTRITGRAAIVGSMDFLCGIARAGAMEFHRVGNGRIATDYAGKGAVTVDLLAQGHEFICCHINAPDEASHMHDVQLKIRSLELIDEHIVGPVVEYFRAHMEELGALMIVPDHYANSSPELLRYARREIHSMEPVPFAVWDGSRRDGATAFNEDAVMRVGTGTGTAPHDHLQLLDIIGVGRCAARVDEPSLQRAYGA